MKIKSLKIKGFRNLKGIDLDFGEGAPIHAFVGSNGQGKTNILEAIYLCSLSKSFRTRSSADMVGFEEAFSSIKMAAGECELEVIITARPLQKVLKVNGVKKSAADFIGQLKAVFFSPDDLSSMAYAPKLRRRYLDVLISQLSQDYLRGLMSYNEACRQRNSLLKAIRDEKAERDELDFWDKKLAQLGSLIAADREAILTELQTHVSRHYKEISKSDQEVTIIYQSECRGISPGEMVKLYQSTQRKDIMTAQTRLGPHRDDLQFFLGGKDMADFASRGEWRSLVLAMKFAEIDLIKERTGEDPVLLLDDVFSELDAERQKYLFDATGRSQTFLTTTHKQFLSGLSHDYKLHELKSGKII